MLTSYMDVNFNTYSNVSFLTVVCIVFISSKNHIQVLSRSSKAGAALVKTIASLLYGTRTMLDWICRLSKKTYTAYDRFHGNGSLGETPTKKEPIRMLGIHRKEKDGDWYIYLQCFAHENSERAYKNTKKYCKSFKLDKSNAVSVGTTAIKPYLFICLVGLVRFARYCGKTYSRHLFAYGGLAYDCLIFIINLSEYIACACNVYTFAAV